MTGLKRALQEQGRRQRWLAEQVQVTEPTVSGWVIGRTSPPLRLIPEIASLLRNPGESLPNAIYRVFFKEGG